MQKPDRPRIRGSDLIGRFLVAMPNMGDPRFHRAVILICAHDVSGAAGLLINRPMPGVMFSQMLRSLNITGPALESGALDAIPVLSGGPVENTRGFLLHSPDFRQTETVAVTPELSVTGTVDAMRAVAAGECPKQMTFLLGYTGWSEGQLEQEIQDNVWLLSPMRAGLVFDSNHDEKWLLAVRRIGVDPAMLSSDTGQA